MRTHAPTFFLFFLLIASVRLFGQHNYLSSLAADKNFPLYTTYAAAMERSNFILDQGYHFQYYMDKKGADFITDASGDIAIGFVQNEKWVYKTSDLYKPVIVKKSYPDLIQYEFQPFPNVLVDISFLVHSSTSAVMQVSIKNKNPNAVNLQVVPFMRKTESPFREIEQAHDGFFFKHEKHPDSWTIAHNVPHADSIQNFFSTSMKPDDWFVFNSEGGEAIVYPYPYPEYSAVSVLLHGRAYLPGKERLAAANHTMKIQVSSTDSPERLITETTLAPGTARTPITNDGYFRLDVNQLPEAAAYDVLFFDEKSQGSFVGTVQKAMVAKGRYDVDLQVATRPEMPKKVTATQNKKGVTISWDPNGGAVTYEVYKKIYPQQYFERIAKGVKGNSWTDAGAKKDEVLSYIVIAKDSKGNSSIHSDEVFNIPMTVFRDYVSKASTHQRRSSAAFAKIVGFKKDLSLAAGESFAFSLQRTIARLQSDKDSLVAAARKLYELPHQTFVNANEQLFKQTPRLPWKDKAQEALYWSANNMMRQVFYPPEGKSSYNYYVFSREPVWGWGHGGQVFHESITMLAYAYIDPISAMNSQRVYKERQHANGYINYRTGPYLDEVIEHNGQLTSSAPWYAWLNWEVYLMTKDTSFLREMYESSKRFYRFVVDNRDSDGDGLAEWGGEAILESVRDALVAVWDQVGYPTNFESLDLNCMLVNEAKSLEKMARELNLSREAEEWKQDHTTRAALLNRTFWDDENGFYYNVNKDDHSFTFKEKDDLKRDEIIGFLPLWAGISSPAQAGRLVERLTDTARFWRPFGVPSLSASDPYYNPKGYWNGPVWVEWNFLIARGLLDYGYVDEARELVDRVARGMIEVLQKDHNLWEFYSPDEPWGGYHKTYIWAGIINRMMMDVYHGQHPGQKSKIDRR